MPLPEQTDHLIASYDPGEYPQFAVTVDIVVFTIVDDDLCVLLIQRGGPPFLGRWALPGGFVKPDEDLDQAAVRELAEETGIHQKVGLLEQFGSYGAPERDPRMRVVTIGYWAILPDLPSPTAGSDARHAERPDATGIRPPADLRRRTRNGTIGSRRPNGRHTLLRAELQGQHSSAGVQHRLEHRAGCRELPT